MEDLLRNDDKNSIYDIVQPLYRAKPWINLVGFMLLLIGVLQVIMVSIAVAVQGGLASLIGFLFGLLLAAPLVWPGVVLIKAASALDDAHLNGDNQALADAMSKLKTYFTIVGVLMLIGFVLAAGSIIIQLVVMAQTGVL
ncbi:DUF5362 family protein [Halorhodospira halochloris]|uniref:DUF5362 family protein n=1 Tax=Halorhodospira halochloris TaxID=1052 RepID=UPI001EE95EFF|nr:DUF5362 family protein [Halorhodospira halochloris]MCG5547570.1 DUF5362 domain-containing protein [Halorhodospira halochloris]